MDKHRSLDSDSIQQQLMSTTLWGSIAGKFAVVNLKAQPDFQ